MGQKFWTMVSENGSTYTRDSDQLFSMFTDIASWHALAAMICTGRPAVMRIVRDDGDISFFKVLATEDVGSRPTYIDPKGS